MPELPEVEAARRALEVHCIGKKILNCTVADDTKVIDGVSPSVFEPALVGKTILSIHRKGKNLWIRLDSSPFPSFQFGMAGAFHIKGEAVTKYKRSEVSSTEEWPSKYSKVFFVLDDGVEVSFTDKRRFARVRLLDDPESSRPISELGPDALFEPMQFDEFVNLLSKKRIPIKALLLDQGCISGIGNWVADEVLYQARIHPQQTAASMPKKSCESLHKSIKEVLEKALEVGADSGQFPNNWIFHSREKKPGKAFVDGKKIEFITTGGRTTAFVPELQKLIGEQSGKVAASRSKKPKANGPVNDESGEEDENDEAVISKPTKKHQRNDDEPEKPAKGPAKKQAKVAASRSKKPKAKGRVKDASGEEDENDEAVIPKPTKKRQRNDDEPEKPAKGPAKKQAKAKEESLNKVLKSSQAGAPQRKKAQKS